MPWSSNYCFFSSLSRPCETYHGLVWYIYGLLWPFNGFFMVFCGKINCSLFWISRTGRRKRDSESIESRHNLIKHIESALPSLVTVIPRSSSHDCILRAICEIAKTPQNDDGLLGDFVNMLLTPTYILDNLSGSHNESDYLQAQRRGHFLQDCSVHEMNCPISLFEVNWFATASNAQKVLKQVLLLAWKYEQKMCKEQKMGKGNKNLSIRF